MPLRFVVGAAVVVCSLPEKLDVNVIVCSIGVDLAGNVNIDSLSLAH